MAGFPLLPLLLLSASPSAVEPRGPGRGGRSGGTGSGGGGGEGAAPGAPGLSCVAAAPSLSWFLLATSGAEGSGGGGALGGGGGGGPFPPRRLERPLRCSATDPDTGRASSAAVLLEVQFRPELVRLEGPGLALVLLVLVEAHPPAQITWTDAQGRSTVNTSHFLIVEAQTFPWPGDGGPPGLRLRLRGLEGNRSLWVEEGPPGAGDASPRQTGLLGLRVELPLPALVAGAALALGAFLCLGALLSRLLCRKGKKEAGLYLPAVPSRSDSSHRQPQVPRMPRANVSLPANLRLNALTPGAAGGAPLEEQEEEEEEERARSEPEHSLVLVERGLGRFPMVGYIYRASSMSSDEIWL